MRALRYIGNFLGGLVFLLLICLVGRYLREDLESFYDIY